MSMQITAGKTRLDLEFGWAEWGHFDSVVVGDRLVPRVIEVVFPGSSEDLQPSLRMTIEVVDGVPLCSKIEMERRDDGRGVQAQDLRSARLDEWIEYIVAGASTRVTSIAENGEITSVMDGWTVEGDRAARKAVRAMRRTSRRKIDRKLLTKVAEVYRTHEDSGKPVEAVEMAFGTSYRSAARWVQRARQEGLL